MISTYPTTDSTFYHTDAWTYIYACTYTRMCSVPSVAQQASSQHRFREVVLKASWLTKKLCLYVVEQNCFKVTCSSGGRWSASLQCGVILFYPCTHHSIWWLKGERDTHRDREIIFILLKKYASRANWAKKVKIISVWKPWQRLA
jgi:hypothetical protein